MVLYAINTNISCTVATPVFLRWWFILGNCMCLFFFQELKQFQSMYKKQYKENIEKWKRELSQDPNTPKKQREAQLQ